ncbi:MAG: PAS domain S-box protein [Salinivirgaceae bacterium]|jgi:PAS domain S-box-containing protein|nr:PAS domain S-box protein [Salinivirgaceae bacterium]
MADQEERNKQLEKELQAAKQELSDFKQTMANFDLLVNNLDEYVWFMNKTLKFSNVSPSVKKIIGYTETEFLKGNLIEVLHPQSEDIVNRTIANKKVKKSDNKSKKWITQIKHKNGTLIWIESTTNPILDSEGNFNGTMGVSRDISAQVELERKMQENEVNLQAQIDNTSDSIWSIDDTYCIKTLNNTFKTYFKLAFAIELNSGMCIINYLPEPFRTQWKERYDRALTGEEFTVTDQFKFDDLPQYVEVSFNPITFKNKVIGASVFSRDITAQKLSEQSLIESTANLSSTIEHTNARIWSIDTDYNIITINKNFHNDYYTAFNVKLERGVFALTNVPEPIYNVWHDRYTQVLNGKSININDEFNIEGVPLFVEVSLNPIRINDRIIGATCFSRDVTEQKLAEHALKDSEARYKSLVDNIPSVSYRCLADTYATMKFISNEIKTLSGYDPEDFIDNKKRSYTNLIHKDDKEYVALLVMEKLENKESFTIEYRIIDKWGKVKWVHNRGRGHYGENGTLGYIDGLISDITIRKKSEQELRQSEQKFRTLSDASIDMLSLNSKYEILKYTSDILAKQLDNTLVLAYAVNDKTKKLKFTNIAGIQASKHKELLQVAGDKPFKQEFPIKSELIETYKKGEFFEYKDSFTEYTSNRLSKSKSEDIDKVLDLKKIYAIGIIKGNELYGIIHFFSKNENIVENKSFIESFANLTSILLQRQQLIENLYHSEEKFRSIFANTSSAITIQDNSKIYLINKAWEEITGYTAEEAKTLTPINLVHPNEREQILEMTQKRLTGEAVPSNYVLHISDKHFNEKWLDLSASAINYKGKKADLIIANDVTERVKADLELKKFSTGIMNSPSSIVITDIDGTIEYVNPYFTEATGYTFEEAVGKNPNILSSGNNPISMYKDMWDSILKGEVWDGELENKNKNGQIYWEAVRIAPIFDQNNIIVNFIAIKEDITERKRTLELIEQSENDLRDINAKKDKFFSIIAHDLRSPFSGLAGLTQILLASHKELSNEEINKYLSLINQSTQSIFKLLENLLSWAKSQTGKMEFNPEPVNLLKLVNETISVIEISAKNKKINIEVAINKDQTVYADENMLNTIVRNIVSNALKYTTKDGKIKIYAEEKSYKNKIVSVINIEDNGVGIPKDKQSKIFNIEHNYSTKGTEKESGTGLGLILCKEFVERHAGDIWCKSKENKGSIFSFTLPKK